MDSSSSHNSSGGIGFFELLAIVFIVMKLMNLGAVGSWPWLWVLSPVWAPICLVLALLTVTGILFLIAKMRSK